MTSSHAFYAFRLNSRLKAELLSSPDRSNLPIGPFCLCVLIQSEEIDCRCVFASPKLTQIHLTQYLHQLLYLSQTMGNVFSMVLMQNRISIRISVRVFWHHSLFHSYHAFLFSHHRQAWYKLVLYQNKTEYGFSWSSQGIIDAYICSICGLIWTHRWLHLLWFIRDTL